MKIGSDELLSSDTQVIVLSLLMYSSYQRKNVVSQLIKINRSGSVTIVVGMRRGRTEKRSHVRGGGKDELEGPPATVALRVRSSVSKPSSPPRVTRLVLLTRCLVQTRNSYKMEFFFLRVVLRNSVLGLMQF